LPSLQSKPESLVTANSSIMVIPVETESMKSRRHPRKQL
jgi:hypothetical protein